MISRSESTVSVSGLVLASAESTSPDQPPNVNPAAGVAVSVTSVPAAYDPASGETAIVPRFVSFSASVSVNSWGSVTLSSNWATTTVSASMVMIRGFEVLVS